MGSAREFRRLYEGIHACRKCPNVVPSLVARCVNDVARQSGIVLMAQAPSDGGVRKSGVHWVGADGRLRKAGVFLDKYLKRLGYSVDPEAAGYVRPYTTNVLHCWPGATGKRDRKPNNNELQNCKPWWLKELDLVRPQVVILLGAPAAESFASVCGDHRSFNELLSAQGESVVFSDFRVKRYVVPHPTSSYRDRLPPYKVKSQIYEEVTASVANILKGHGPTRP